MIVILPFIQKYLIPVAAVIIVVLIAVLVVIFQARKKKRGYEEYAQMRRRDQALNDALSNSQMQNDDNSRSTPVEITWDHKAIRSGDGSKQQMIELVEESTYSSRKYVFRSDEKIRIGTANGNQLELVREGVESYHCEIFQNGKDICLRSLNGSNTILVRKKTSAFVSDIGVILRSGDQIRLGSAVIRFRVFTG